MPFLNNKINLFISLLENINVFLNLFFNSSSILIEQFLLQDKDLYFHQIILGTFIFKKAMTILTFNLLYFPRNIQMFPQTRLVIVL